MKKIFAAAVVAVLVTAGLAPASATATSDKSDNIKKVADLKLGWVSEIAFQGRWAYAFGEQLSIIDRTSMEVVSTFTCGPLGLGGTEVEIVKPGFIAIDVYQSCGFEWAVIFIDVRNPRDPRIVSGVEGASSHTMTAYPGKPIIYSSPNGCCGDLERGIERIIDATNPAKPKMYTFTSDGLGCHDVAFVIRKDRKLAACAGGAETQLWDVSDPLKPKTVARIPTPQVFFNHSAGFSDDGKLLVVGDEAHGVNSCTGTPTGALWFYDVTNPEAPAPRGYYNISRGAAVSSFWATYDKWCTAHMYDFKPDTKILATGWFQGGLNVLDVSDPMRPKELAYYIADDFKAWGAYWVDGLIWTSDYGRKGDGGVEVFKVDLGTT